MRKRVAMRPIPIAVATEIGHSYGYDQVVVMARRVGDDGGDHVTTAGITPQHCEVAAMMGNQLKRVMQWPESECNAVSASSIKQFKNFHRSLCERFGYVHDEKHWQRDLVSLEEHIAKRHPSAISIQEAARAVSKECVIGMDEAFAAFAYRVAFAAIKAEREGRSDG